jgi:glycosyltransferase involved in cell wall biosynthesis
MLKKNNPFTVFFAYTKPENFSGQTAASELIINSLSEQGFVCVPILLYPLDRNIKNPFQVYIQLILKQIKTFPILFKFALSNKPILHLNLGQSYWSFLRVGFWYFPIRFINRGVKVVTSLHGSTFMSWERKGMKTRIFMSFLNSSRIITVLGENQKMKLEQFGLSSDKIRVVPNSCNMKVVSNSFIKKKHSSSNWPVTLLHLSLLIESKGFPIYLEALELLSKMKLTQTIKAFLCGPLTFSSYCNQFKSTEDKKLWIESKVDLINRTSNGMIAIEWIAGARGEVKQKLFEDSHIFIFPSSFPVEAQPIVLLEALATGSSIITSTAGEIQNTLNNDCAVFIEKPEPKILAEEIYKLINKPEMRMTMALNGAELIKGQLGLDFHIDTWKRIFSEVNYYM